ncbi:MAG TPA: hypothetical protein VFZ68_00230 [Acidimicrobiales bacterium]
MPAPSSPGPEHPRTHGSEPPSNGGAGAVFDAEVRPVAEGGAAPDADVDAEADAEEATRANDVRAVVQAALDAASRAGTLSAAGVADAVEGAGRALTRRVVAAAVNDPSDVGDPDRLARALAEGPSAPVLGNATVAAVAARAAARFRPFAFLSRRTPLWIMAAGVPALVTSVSRGAHELELVASHLAYRARAAGVTPDVERVRRAAIQVVANRTVDPDSEPGHGRLVVGWLRRGARVVLPFGDGISTKDPEGMAARAAEVDPASLGSG